MKPEPQNRDSDLIKSAGELDLEESKAIWNQEIDACNPWPLSPERQRMVLVNSHCLLRKQYKSTPLWVFVRQLTTHGSGYSQEICRECGWDPDQDGSIPIT